VESVAWVTERKDVLSGLFFFLTILTYLKACEVEGTKKRRWLAGSVGCYLLALASKSIVMTLPFVLMLLDIYPLRRLGRWHDWTTPEARRIWAEKIPYVLLAVAGAGMVLHGVSTYLLPLEKYPPPARVGMALSSLWFYLWKTVFPLELVPMYELPARVYLLDPLFVVSAIAVGIITGGVLLTRRRWPAGLAVWLYYAGTLAPVSGIVHVGPQLTADRYSYLSCLGWALLVGAGVCAVVRAGATGKLRPSVARLAAVGGTVWLLGLAALTWQQVQVWRDSDTLWRYAIEINPNCAACHTGLAVVLINQGYTALAMPHLQRALALRPDKVLPHELSGYASARLRRLSEASQDFRRALELDPANAQARYNLGTTLMLEGELDEGIEQLRQAIRLKPAHVWAHTNLGTALTLRGNPTAAVEHFRRAIELDPGAALPRYGLAQAYLALGRSDLAQDEYEVVKRLDHRLASLLSPLVKR
jgi:tetratricopeptide (TPR) repeat protein